jgi:central kinetochore subunit Mal2/MCM21
MANLEEINDEIATLRTRISTLNSQRETLSSILLSTPHLQARLRSPSSRLHPSALKRISQQSSLNQENIYRVCAGITAYKIKDPDPNAVDDGNVLGMRIEVFVQGKFEETYHVLFKRLGGGGGGKQKMQVGLKVCHHTVPACIPIRQLAERWLAQGQGRRGGEGVEEQDLGKFGRALRKELVAWHLRRKAVEGLRREAGLPVGEALDKAVLKEAAYGRVLNAFTSDDEEDEEGSDEEDGVSRRDGSVKISELEADMGVREIVITWSDNRTGAVSLSKDGEIKEGVFRSANGSRISDLDSKALGRMEGLVQRLSS